MIRNCGSASFETTVEETKPTHTFEFRWEVNGLHKLASNEELRSPQFSPIPGQIWCVIISGNAYIYISSKKEFRDLYANFKISISNSNDLEVHKDSKYLLLSNSGRNCLTYLSSSKETINFNDLMKKIKIYILIEIRKIDGKTSIGNLDSSFKPTEKVALKLAEHYKAMYETSKFTDVNFCVQDKSIKAHKSVLGARSRTFARMFEHESGETIVINDVTFSAMNYLLLFMYSGYEVHCSYDLAFELYYAADKYEVLDLRQICAKILVSLQNEENFCDLIILADRHKDADFKEMLLSFAKNNFAHIFSQDKWKELIRTETTLASEIVAFVSQQSDTQ